VFLDLLLLPGRIYTYIHTHTYTVMKILTTNFVKCAVKSCDSSTSSFPLRYRECQLQQVEQDFQPEFILNILNRVEWDALLAILRDLGNTSLPQERPNITIEDIELLKNLHELLIETNITEGEMVCPSCEHIYYIKNSIPNFLLPPHLA
jgi:multifunctional methyltransferase subunit TRM112